VTYDRRGRRRLGAILGGEVVDLPDAVGHPAFPTTLEALVGSSGGTVLEAARAALERDEAERFVVAGAPLLASLYPVALRSTDAFEGGRRVLGPDEEIPWPHGAAWLSYQPKVVAVLAHRDIDPDDPASAVFGYTLLSDWSARDSSGDPTESAEGMPMSIGPCVVTADEVDPQTIYLSVRVDGESWAKGNLNGAVQSLEGLVSTVARGEAVGAGDAFALGPFGVFGVSPSRQLWPGAVVSLEAEGIGTLRNRLGTRA